MRPGNSIRKYKNIAGLFLVLLYLGYLGSVTFFHHSHTIGDITVVHSHPHKSHNDNSHSGHDHSEYQLILIHFLSVIITIGTVVFYGITITQKAYHRIFLYRKEIIIPNLNFSGINRPRAPSVQ
ncbi:MAG: hypothetical protein GX158_02885 [Bacteroidales bacterium]|jgi:hypothetical protein|nr:hypothetical protein [Bacteroidales bacterium]